MERFFAAGHQKNFKAACGQLTHDAQRTLEQRAGAAAAQQVAEIGYVVGEVKGKTAVLVDDMIDTAGTLQAAARTVLEEGAARVIACATHGVFSGAAYERLRYENSGIERIVVTDTIPTPPGEPDNITVLSTAQTLADSIRRIFADDSVSEIFAGENQLF